MQLIIEHGIVNLDNSNALCHKTVLDYCKDRYKRLNMDYKCPDNIPENEFSNLLWNGISDEYIVTKDNMGQVLFPGYIIGFFTLNGSCMHSMVVFDYNIWVGTNNFQTFSCAADETVGFYDIDTYIDKDETRKVLKTNGKIEEIDKSSTKRCGSHWSIDGKLWVKDYTDNDADKCKIKYRDIIKKPITYCSICQYQ